MLTIQPNLVSSYSKSPAFGRSVSDDEYVDYQEILDDDSVDSFERDNYPVSDFDLETEKEEISKDLDLWKQTKHNIDSIAKTTESVPGVKTGMKIFSGLISVAIGWGGLRWGAAGTLEALSKFGETRVGKALKSWGPSSKEIFTRCKDAVTKSRPYKAVGTKLSAWKESFLSTTVGNALKTCKDAVTTNRAYTGAAAIKDNIVAKAKNINPKRVFIETMGVAGGGTAAINTIGGKSVDGVNHKVDVDENGNYFVDGRYYLEDKGDYSDVA